MKLSDWLKIRNGHGILIYSAGQGLKWIIAQNESARFAMVVVYIVERVKGIMLYSTIIHSTENLFRDQPFIQSMLSSLINTWNMYKLN